MSALYNLEPQPTAKVLLKTSLGDILLELFAKQTPLASRNFLQHCLDGYYNDTVFHRIVPGFILQAGDPTGTGHGGQAAYNDGAPFEDEFHSRLKFNRRGLLGMANSGAPNDNGSQFFITLGAAAELQNKNTMFGRVEGKTIYNVIKIGDAELVQAGDRPLYPTKIIRAEILVNPFDGMVKRERATAGTTVIEQHVKKKPKRKPAKTLLSFAGDGSENEDSLPCLKKPKFHTKLITNELPLQIKPDKTLQNPNAGVSAKSSPKAPSPVPDVQLPRPTPPGVQDRLGKRSSSVHEEPPKSLPLLLSPRTTQQNYMQDAQAEIEALKASMRRPDTDAHIQKHKPKSSLASMIPDTSTRGRKRGVVQNSSSGNEVAALALFNSFKRKLDTVQKLDGQNPGKAHTGGNSRIDSTAKSSDTNNYDDEEAVLCDLHFIANCQSCGDWIETEQGDDDSGQGWLTHKLTFEKDRLGKDLEWKRKNEEELVVVNPKDKARALGVDRVGYADGEKGKREWDRDRDRDRKRNQSSRKLER